MRPHTFFISLAASPVCVGCTSSATAPSAANPSGPPALEGPPASPAAKLPTLAEPVNLNPADISAVRGFGYRLRTEEAR